MHCAELLLFSTNVNQPKVRTKDSMALLAQGLYFQRPAGVIIDIISDLTIGQPQSHMLPAHCVMCLPTQNC
jgi:hypothetical protein